MQQDNFKKVYLIRWSKSDRRYNVVEIDENLSFEKNIGSHFSIFRAEDDFFDKFPWFSKNEYSFEYNEFWSAYQLIEKPEQNEIEPVGYHVSVIEKGILGEVSKIIEEIEEFKDALKQGVSVMAILELADLLCAVELYLEKHHPTITIEDLIRMKDVTRRAFRNGHRN